MTPETTSGAFDPAYTVKALATPEYVESVSYLLAEPPAAVEKALLAAIPALLSGIANQVSDETGAKRVLRLIEQASPHEASTQGLPLAHSAAPEQLRAGAEIVKAIFGVRATRVIEAVAQHAGLRESSAASIVGLSAPLVIEKLRQLGGELDSSWLMDAIGAQRSAIFGLVPPDISTMTGLGGGLLAPGTAKAAPPLQPPPPPPLEPRFGRYKLIFIAAGAFVVLLLAAALAYVARGHRQQPNAALISISLPNHAVVNVSSDGFHRALQSFLAHPTAEDLPKRFLCDHIDFYPDSSRLKPASIDAVDSLATILKAYPSVSFRMEANAVAHGNYELSPQLAIDRTQAVAARIEASGVDVRRMEEGVYIKTAPAGAKTRDQSELDDGFFWLVVTKI